MNALEIHALNDRREVVLQGWFSRDVGLALIGNRPSSLIAIDGETLPHEVASELAELGHSIVLVPPTKHAFNETTKRCAKDICSIGVTLAEKMN
jgi:hypothetical protein